MSVTIHIGYPKSASTSIQKHLSNLSNEVVYLGKNSQHPDSKKVMEILGLAIVMEEMTFIHKLEEFQNRLYNIIKKYNHVFLSEEQIIGGNDVWLVANRLKKLFCQEKDLRILMITRKYDDVIKSEILDKKLFFIPANNYLNSTLEFHFNKPYHSMLKKYFYYDTYSTYSQLFGEKNVKLLPFELLKANKTDFILEIYNFMGIDNPKIPENNTQAHASGIIRSLRREYSKMRRYILKDISLKKYLRTDSNQLLSKIENNKFYNKLMYLRGKKIILNEENTQRIHSFYQEDYNLLINNGFTYIKEYEYL